MKVLQKRNRAERRLIKAAETEVLLFHKEHHEARFVHGDDDASSVVENRDDAALMDQQQREEEDDSFVGRCTITCIDLSTRCKSTTKKKARIKAPNSPTRRVNFQRYDEVIDDNGIKNYIYSLHDREVEEEIANYDVMDKFEETVSDVGYFFTTLGTGLREEAMKQLGKRRRRGSTS